MTHTLKKWVIQNLKKKDETLRVAEHAKQTLLCLGCPKHPWEEGVQAVGTKSQLSQKIWIWELPWLVKKIFSNISRQCIEDDTVSLHIVILTTGSLMKVFRGEPGWYGGSSPLFSHQPSIIPNWPSHHSMRRWLEIFRRLLRESSVYQPVLSSLSCLFQPSSTWPRMSACNS